MIEKLTYQFAESSWLLKLIAMLIGISIPGLGGWYLSNGIEIGARQAEGYSLLLECSSKFGSYDPKDLLDFKLKVESRLQDIKDSDIIGAAMISTLEGHSLDESGGMSHAISECMKLINKREQELTHQDASRLM